MIGAWYDKGVSKWLPEFPHCRNTLICRCMKTTSTLTLTRQQGPTLQPTASPLHPPPCETAPAQVDTVEIRFPAVRWPRFWVRRLSRKTANSSAIFIAHIQVIRPILSLDIYGYNRELHLTQHKLCTRKTELALKGNFISNFTELCHKCWPMETMSKMYFRRVKEVWYTYN